VRNIGVVVDYKPNNKFTAIHKAIEIDKLSNKYENKSRLNCRIKRDLSYSLIPIFAYFLLIPE
jgi:hypothetical protein